MEQYLKEHQLTPFVIQKWGLHVTAQSISVPVRDMNGTFLYSKTRHLIGDAKFTYPKGATAALFGAHLITHDTETVYILEGEIKVIAFKEYLEKFEPTKSVPVVSSTGGSRTWNDEWNGILKGKNVYIMYDNDDAGMEGAVSLWYRLSKSNMPTSINIVAITGKYKDVNEMFYADDAVAISKMIPQSISILGIKDGSKRSDAKIIKKLMADLDIYEVLAETDQQRSYVKLVREIVKPMRQQKKLRAHNVNRAESLDDIKKIPITNFIHFNGGVAPCLWHSDRNPSLHYNGPESTLPNTVKCFSCGKFGDVIDVVMAQQDISFKDAVEYLRN